MASALQSAGASATQIAQTLQSVFQDGDTQVGSILNNLGYDAGTIAGVLLGSGLIRDVPYTGDRSVDVVGSILSVLGMSLLVLGVLALSDPF